VKSSWHPTREIASPSPPFKNAITGRFFPQDGSGEGVMIPSQILYGLVIAGF
jgi:hypothetical protein